MIIKENTKKKLIKLRKSIIYDLQMIMNVEHKKNLIEISEEYRNHLNHERE